MSAGFLCVLKPPGMTSGDVVLAARRRLARGEKVGHAGTLDPEAAGVLPLMIGRAARLFPYVVEKEKEYVAQLVPGWETDTQDAQGRVIAGEGERVSREALEAALPAFVGDILQTPPMYSAVKRGGKRLYELARQGETVEVESRPTKVFSIDVTEALPDGSFLLRVVCGRGTYIRTLCNDIGRALGCRAHMGFLLRTRAGVFTLDGAHTLEEIMAAEDLSALLLPPDAPLGHMPRCDVSPGAERFVRNGNPLTLRELNPAPQEGIPTRLYISGKFAGIGRYREGAMRFDIMLLE